MPAPALDPPGAVKALIEAVLIGLLVGAQREPTPGGPHPGLRDFTLIAIAAGICGLLEQPWLTASALLGTCILLAVFHYEKREQRQGVTTELAAVATFCIAYLITSPALPFAAPIAIAAGIGLVAFLEFKQRLTAFFRDTITEREFNGTLAFIAVVLVIYPLLPQGSFGPFGFFTPRRIWFYVILVSSISYAGYFLQKFLGTRHGLQVTAILGGLASTLAATTDFARRSKLEDPRYARPLAAAAVIANTVQFPRTLLILSATSQSLARAGSAPIFAAFVTGAIFSIVLSRITPSMEAHVPPTGNPFRLRPALTFGALFAAVELLSKASIAGSNGVGLYAASILGGLVDVGTVIVSSAGLVSRGTISQDAAINYVLIGLTANIVAKALIAFVAGSWAFAWRLAAALAAMLLSGGLVWIFMR